MKGSTTQNDWLKYALNATAFSWNANTNLFIALHTADPGVGGSQTTSECNYTGYTRVTVARTSGGFTVAAAGAVYDAATNAALITFPACTAGSNTATHFSIGTATSGAGQILWSGPLTAAIPVSCCGLTTDGTTTNCVYAPGNGSTWAVNDQIGFITIPGQALPGGISQGTIYYVLTRSTDKMTISTTQGGSTLTITTNGGGYAYKPATLAISSGITPQFAIGDLNVVEA